MTGMFDRFASAASTFVARAPFFACCVLLVVVWLPSLTLFGNVDTWQLVINTVTTIVTFLLVALLQNAQERFERATNVKLDAIADYLADTALGDPALRQHAEDLRRAVGIEDRITA